MKRVLLTIFVLAVTLAAAYAWAATRRERDYRLYIDQGESALARDDTFSAIESFSGAIALKPDSMLGFLKRGEAYRRRGELEAALRDLRHASEIDPVAPRPLELLGDVNYALLRYDRAVECYRKCIRLDDRAPRIHYKLGLALYEGRQTVSAIAALRQAVSLNERFAEAYYVLGLCQRDTQKPQASLASLERSVKLAPALIHAREELAELYGRLGRSADRIAQMEALLALDPGPSREVALGLAYAAAGQEERAIMTLGRAAERFPDHPYTYVALGRVWLERAQARRDRVDLSKALGALQEAVGADDSSEALTLFGRALLMTAENETAESMLLQATQKLPADPLAFFYLADAAERRGHVDTARRALLDYVALEGDQQDPRRSSALANRIAELSVRTNDLAAALMWYRRAITSQPADLALLVRYADVQARTGDRAGARATISSVLEKNPADPAARALLRRVQ